MYLKKLINELFVAEKLWRCLFIAIIPALLFYSISLIVLRAAGFGYLEIIRDTAQQTELSSFLGFLSNIGIWLWVSSAAICFFIVLSKWPIVNKSRKELLFLSGMLSILLAVDDFFMIHDRYVSQKLCYLIYAAFSITLLVRHYKTIMEIEGFVFLLAGFLLASSIFTDLIQSRIPAGYENVQVIEEGFKFVGAATWLYFNFRVASFREAVI